MRVCAIVPSYRHADRIGAIVARLCAENLTVFVVDDGNAESIRTQLAALYAPDAGVVVLRLEKNQGKGGAVMAGMRAAAAAGFTHALQVDADGQHDLSALPQFLALAGERPAAVICGRPIYDASIPLGRKIGRWITHVWVWIETLSRRIDDSMCGFRLYPLAPCLSLMERKAIGRRMDFDIEILVRLFWMGVAPVSVDVRVTYPPNNPSNFDVLKDNLRISWMHARLFFSMLAHLPVILAHRPPTDNARDGARGDWAALRERGVYLGLKFCAVTCRLLGRGGRAAVLAPIVLYFYLNGAVQRRASRRYLARVLGRKPTAFDGYRHFMNFAMRALDVFLAWTGRLPQSAMELSNGEAIHRLMDEGCGGLLLVSHLGNVDAVRAMVDKRIRDRFTVLVHTRHAVNYNRILKEGARDAGANLFQVTEIGPETVIALKERVEAGGWVVIAADRTPVTAGGRSVSVPFLGAPARFPEGPWILGALLDCPVYLLFCVRDGGCYRASVEKFSDRIRLARGDRERSIADYAARFADRLAQHCMRAPYQWYNFYDFWEA